MLEPRDYQKEAFTSLHDYWRGGGGHGLIVLPTGTGKSVVLAMLCMWADNIGARVVVLTHVEELVQQNHAELLALWPQAPAGIYHAGLKQRDTDSPIIFGGIQSAYERAANFGPRQIVLIDEAQLVPHGSNGMYHRFFGEALRIEPHLRIAGLTATPYRMASGMLTERWRDDAALFDAICFERPLTWFIDEGYLAPLVTKATGTRLTVTNAELRSQRKTELAVNHDSTTEAAIGEVYSHNDSRRYWLLFGAGIKHATAVAEITAHHGRECGIVTGKPSTTGAWRAGKFEKLDRPEVIEAFKSGQLTALANNLVLTTGFNAPAVDLIADLAPTGSPGLHVQKYGRGTRLAPGKDNCLVLDFAGNVARHGPLDTITGAKKPGEGPAPVKECPECATIQAAGRRTCTECGYEWPEAELRIFANAQAAALLSTQDEARWLWVDRVHVSSHNGKSGYDMLRVQYRCGLTDTVSEFVCLEHPPGNYARTKAHQWWQRHSGGREPPSTVREALGRLGELRYPGRLLVQRRGKYYDVIDRDLAITAEGV